MKFLRIGVILLIVFFMGLWRVGHHAMRKSEAESKSRVSGKKDFTVKRAWSNPVVRSQDTTPAYNPSSSAWVATQPFTVRAADSTRVSGNKTPSYPKTISKSRSLAPVTRSDPVPTNHGRIVPEFLQAGFTDKILIQPKQKVSVKVAYPQADPGEGVVVSVQDGGFLKDGKGAEVVNVDNDRNLYFDFQASESRGIHRVMLRRGADMKEVDFWAGEELPMARQ